MDHDELEAARTLIEFARNGGEYPLEAADILEAYLDGEDSMDFVCDRTDEHTHA